METGIAIDAGVLGAIYRAERLVLHELAPQTARCRIRHDTVVIELDAQSMAALDADTADSLQQRISGLLAAAGVAHPVSFQRYRMGSAFLRPADVT